jgi:signal peptidase II
MVGPMNYSRLIFVLIFALICFLGDQYTKTVILDMYTMNELPIQVTSYFNLVYALNKGISFGFLGGSNENMPYYLSGFSLTVSVILLIWLFRERILPLQLGLGLIIAGGTGNAFDRLSGLPLREHAVVDFLQFHYHDWYFPAFNVADICINMGVALVLLEVLFFSRYRSNT